MGECQPIAVIPIDPRHELRITLENSGGHMRFQQRVWFLKDGGWRPGNEGVGLQLRLIEPLIAVMQKVRLQSTGGGAL